MAETHAKGQTQTKILGAQAPIGKTCELCDVSSSEWKCIECNQLICSKCKKIHSRGTATKKHQIIELKNATSGSFYQTTCDAHKSQPYQLYCKHCSVLVCNKCITGTHEGHKFCEVDQIVDKKKRLLEESVDGLRESLKLAHDDAESFNKERKKTIKSYDSAKRSVENYVEKMIAEVEKCGKELIKFIENGKSETTDEMKLLENKHETRKNAIARLINDIEIILQSQDSLKIVQCHASFEEKLEETIPPEIERLATSVPNFIPLHEDFPIKANDLIGKLEFESSKPRKKPSLKKKLSQVSILSTDSSVGAVTTTAIRHCFQVLPLRDHSIGCIAVLSETEAWLACPYDQNVSLVRRNGSLTKEIPTEFNISDIAVTKSGDLLVSSVENHGLKLIKDDVVHDFMDTFPSEPHGVSTTQKGDILICLTNGDFGQVTRLSESGKVKQELDTYIIGQQSYLFRKPVRCVETLNGDIWILDEAIKKIIVMNKKGSVKFIWEGPYSEKKRIEPSGLDCDDSGNVLVTDYDKDRIYRVNAESGQTEILQVDQSKYSMEDPYGIAVYSDKFIWVGCDDGRVLVMRYDRN